MLILDSKTILIQYSPYYQNLWVNQTSNDIIPKLEILTIYYSNFLNSRLVSEHLDYVDYKPLSQAVQIIGVVLHYYMLRQTWIGLA